MPAKAAAPTFYYAVASSPLLKGPAIFKDWTTASPCCIDPKTGRPYATARFKKFKLLHEAESFIERNRLQTTEPAFHDVPHLTRENTQPPILPKASTLCETPSRKRSPPQPWVSPPDKKSKIHSSPNTPQTSFSLAPITLKNTGSSDHNTLEDDTLEIYTDGSCLHNGKVEARGGYGVFFSPNDSRNLCGPLPNDGQIHTNQRAELFAILMALRSVEHDQRRVIVHSDSHYSLQCLNTWLPKWRQNGFKTSKNTPVKNLDLIHGINQLIEKRGKDKFQFKFVAAHRGIVGNEAADKLARQGMHAAAF